MPASSVVEILRTKLYRPRPPERFLKRRRLMEQLEAGLDRPVTVVTAPAGYGKTMLVSSWLADSLHPSGWVSLDDGDNDLLAFLTYLIAAVQMIYPDACSGSAALLQGVNPAPLPVLQTRLLNELDLLPQKTILILDDYHLIQCPEIHSLLVHLINHMPPDLHLVICSRTHPPFPFPVWRARQKVNEIDTRDLIFTRFETEQFLHNVLGTALPAETIRILSEKTEGWITGLQLAAYSFHKARVPAAFVTSFQKNGAQNIREFLLDQAFLCQPPPIQEFLLKTSILDRFSAPLCNALGLSGENLRSTQDTLDILSRSNLFIVPIDEQGEWFRYHNLFAEMLQRRLVQQFQPETIQGLHHKAMEWFEAHDAIDEAIQHALAANDEIDAAVIVERHCFEALNQERNAGIDRWLAALPQTLLDVRPRLMIIRCWIESYRERGVTSGTSSARLRKTQAVVNTLQAELDPETRILLDGYASALWPHYLIYTGEFETGAAQGERAIQILPPGHDYVRGRAVMGWALCMQGLGRGAEAVQYILSELAGHPEVNAYTLAILQTLCSLYAMCGRRAELEQSAQRLCTQAEANGYLILSGWGHYMLGLADYVGYRLESAAQHFERVADMQYLISKSIVRESLVGLSLVYQALGDSTGVQDTLRRLSEFEGSSANDYQCSLQARLALMRNDLPTAERWSMPDPDSRPAYLFAWLEIPHFTQARVWVIGGKPENLNKAVALLADLGTIATRMGCLWRVTESQVWLACAFYQQGKRSAALDLLTQTIRNAQPAQFDQLFIETGPLMEEMLAQVDNGDSIFVRQILARIRLEHRESECDHLLTRREVEVLRLLEEHLSEREIATRLSVSPDTVKKHCYHIYNKLGVNRRRDAVAVARGEGIL
jgi:LuxR family maltose regulon positive regulatory protein